MKEIIIAYPIKEIALQLRDLLEEHGLPPRCVCGTGASVLGMASDMRGGVVICASLLRDMPVSSLAERLPAGFDIIALNTTGVEEYIGNIISVPLPLDRNEFVTMVEILMSSQSSFTDRTPSDAELISNAKAILMAANHITEMQAHKRLQRESMNRGKSIAQVAKEIVRQFN